MGLIQREFCRTSVDAMSAAAWLAMHEHAASTVHWDLWRDLVQFEFTPVTWTWLVLQYPELACAAQQ